NHPQEFCMKPQSSRISFVFCISFIASLTTAEQTDKIRVACVGDSITFGAGVKERNKNSYPKVLAGLLGEKYDVRNFGVNGATLLKKGNKPWWKLRAFKDATAFKPNVVIIKLGTNDSKPPNWKHKSEYASDLTALVEHFQGLDLKPTVYLCRPAPVARDRWGINEKTVKGEIIPLIEQVAKDKGLSVIDIYSALKPHADLIPDGVHPNAAGAKILAKTVFDAVKAD
ncbi:MAG: GDSL-type esterase/lipase family protein, partial [Planctomycetota bacterium]|nr:GDSL-type esterase/lipase family protein [Planctomycetota bacterium]